MVAPLIIGAARVAGTAAVRTAGRSRIARATALTAEKAGTTRFTQTQSLAARAGKRTLPLVSKVTPQSALSYIRTSRVRKTEEGEDTPSQIAQVAQKILGLVADVRLFLPLVPPLIFVSIGIAILSLVGLLVFGIASVGDCATSWSTACSIVQNIPIVGNSILGTAITGKVVLEAIGMLFIALSFICVLLAYPAVLIYLVVLKGIKPFSLTGLPFVLFFILPVFDSIPGLNIFPWLILWTFLLCTIHQEA